MLLLLFNFKFNNEMDDGRYNNVNIDTIYDDPVLVNIVKDEYD